MLTQQSGRTGTPGWEAAAAEEDEAGTGGSTLCQAHAEEVTGRSFAFQSDWNADQNGQLLLMSMDNKEENCKSIMKMARQIEEKCKTVEEEDELEVEEAWDDVSGRALDPKQVKKARQEEIDYIHKMKLYEKVMMLPLYAV